MRQTVLNFTIKDGIVEFDVENGDGQTCEVLARVFTDDNDVTQYRHKQEYSKPAKATGRRVQA